MYVIVINFLHKWLMFSWEIYKSQIYLSKIVNDVKKYFSWKIMFLSVVLIMMK